MTMTVTLWDIGRYGLNKDPSEMVVEFHVMIVVGKVLESSASWFGKFQRFILFWLSSDIVSTFVSLI